MRKKIYYIFCLFFILFLLVFSGCKIEKTEREYSLVFFSTGSGYISCNYPKESSIAENTYVILTANKVGDGNFIAWYKDGKEFSKNTYLNICIDKNTNLEARFTGTNYKDQSTTKIADLEEKNVKVYGTIQNVSGNYYVVSDETGSLIIQSMGLYKVGDVILIEGTPSKENTHYHFYSDAFSMKVDEEKVDREIKSVDLNSINKYFGYYTNISGTLVYADYTYYLNVEKCFYTIRLYDFDSSLLDEYIGYSISLNGHLLNLDGKYVDFMIESINKISDDINSDTNLIAYFSKEWKNAKISIDGAIYTYMTHNGDYFFVTLDKRVSTVQFKYEDYETEVFSYDNDYNCFILTDERFNDLYSGYFTKVEDKDNDVKKITCLEMNDLHGYITQTSGVGGISNAAYVVNEIRNENKLDDVLLVANGDMFQGTAISNLSYGVNVVDAMNIMNFDVMGLGNHEFDWGLEYVLALFDKNTANGEATFPLLNSNVYYAETNKLMLSDDYNMVDSIIIEKNGVKIGIVSAIGELTSSILYSKVKDYVFKDPADCLIAKAKQLKEKGADIIIANVHDGNTNDPTEFDINKDLALATYNNKPLFDCVINGHTHVNQQGNIVRSGNDMPIVQAKSYCACIGEVELYYDTVTKKIVFTNTQNYDVKEVAKNQYDKDVEKSIDESYSKYKDILTKEYCISDVTISYKSELYDWVGSVITTCTGTSVSIINTGGIRSTGSIYKGTRIGIENVYMINPFDNAIVIVKMNKNTLYNYLVRSSSISYTFDNGVTLGSLKGSNDTIDVAVLDYVYYWNGFPKGEVTFTNLILRELMIMDLDKRTRFNPITSPKSVLPKQNW